MKVTLKTLAWPTREPVTLEALRAQVRVDDDADDAVLRTYLAAARSHVEALTGRPIVPRSVAATFYRWPGCGYGLGGSAPFGPGAFAGTYDGAVFGGSWGGYWGDDRLVLSGPVASVDAISYTAADGSTQGWTPGQWLARTSPGEVTHVVPATGQGWPVLGVDPVIVLTATAGFATIPPALAQAVLLLAAHFHLNREEVLTGSRITAVQLPLGVADLIAPYRWQWVG